MAVALTEPAVRAALKRAETDKVRLEVVDASTAGLRLRVTPAGVGGWVLACRDRLGAMRRFTLGSWPDMGIGDARKAAQAMRVDVRRGADPIAAKRTARVEAKAQAERDRLTLEVLVADWTRMHLAKRSLRYRSEAVRALQHAFEAQWSKPAEDLDRATVRRVLDGMDRRRAKRGNVTDRAAIQARTVAYGRACFGWASKREMVPGNPFVALPLPEEAPSRDRVLTNAELSEVLLTAGVTETYGRIVRLLALTGQRREEIAGMAWSELSRDLTTWTIPAARMKSDHPHIVPLSPAAREALAGLKRDTGLVFPSRANKPFSGWAKSKSRLDAAIAKARVEAAEAKIAAEKMPPWRLHDLRRTVATGLQAIGIRLEVTEAVLGHISGTRAGIVGVYQRHDWAIEKRAALNAWGAVVTGLLNGTPSEPHVFPIELINLNDL